MTKRQKRVHYAVLCGVVVVFGMHEIAPHLEHYVALSVNLIWLLESYV